MFDTYARRLIDPPLSRAGARLARAGVSPDAMTLAGAAAGIGAAVAIANASFLLGLGLILLSRLADGLDGAIARAGKRSDYGGYLDIVCDFAVWAALPVGFAIAAPANLLPATALLASFYFNGTTFLGFAILAEKRGIETNAHGDKALYYSDGLLEGGETIAFFLAVCLFPAFFPVAAWVFAGLCVITGVLRLIAARRVFG